MSTTYPTSIPTPFEGNEVLADAYRRGWNHGHGLACHNVPVLGETYWTEAEGKITATVDDIRDVHAALCYAAESNSRQFSPFEFTAHEFNEYGDGDDDDDSVPSADEMWEAFDAGTADAIAADLATYTDEDYGIDAEG